MPAQTSLTNARASWETDMDVFLIDAMIDQAKAGKRADSGFKKEAWVAVHGAINEEFNKSFTIQQIKTRIQTLKSKYTTISAMLHASGFGWDPNHNVVLVHDDVWERYIKEHPKASDYRKKTVPYYDQLVDLFEGTYATGDYSLSSDEPFPSDFVHVQNPAAEVPQADLQAATAVNEGMTHTPAAESEERLDQGATRNNNRSGSQHAGGRKRSRDSGGALIADAINEVALEMRSRNSRMKVLTPSQKAVRVLQKVYAEQFSPFEMAQAFDVMLDENKAKLFVVMEEGEVRDIWLANQLRAIV